jgi:hypothetical protein
VGKGFSTAMWVTKCKMWGIQMHTYVYVYVYVVIGKNMSEEGNPGIAYLAWLLQM